MWYGCTRLSGKNSKGESMSDIGTEETTRVSASASGSAGVITFYNTRSNALTSGILQSMIAAVKEFSSSDSISSIIIRSDGDKVFCAGADLSELRTLQTAEEATAFFSYISRFLIALLESPKCIICRVQGKAVGGALGIIAASDYVLAHENAHIRLTELEVGIGPFVIAPVLERKIGMAELNYMSIDAEWRDPAWAERNGLYSKVFSGLATLDDNITLLTEKISTYNRDSFRELKKTLYRNDPSLNELLLERAKISGRFAISQTTQSKIKHF